MVLFCIVWYRLISFGIVWYRLVSDWSVWYQLAKIGGTLKWSPNVKERSTQLKHVSDHRRYFRAKKIISLYVAMQLPPFPPPIQCLPEWRNEIDLK